MAKIADLTVAGKSGTEYTFAIYPINTNWKEIGAVYVVTKRTEKPDGGGTHTYIYVGQTDNMNERHSNHHKASCFQRHNANCIGVLVESNETKRLKIEDDILKRHSWPCND